jgi:SdpI/YhfL family protein
MKIVALVILLGGLAVLAIFLPLALRKVAMNRLWGVRVRAAFESDERWYDINAYGGRLVSWGSLLIIGTGIAGFFLPVDALEPYVWSAAVISALSVLVPVVQTCWWIRRHKAA